MEQTAPMAVARTLESVASLLKKTDVVVPQLQKFVSQSSGTDSVDTEKKEIPTLPQLATKLKGKVYKLATSIIPKLGKNEGQKTKLRTWIEKSFSEVLGLKKLTQAQRHFAQIYIIRLVMDSLSPETEAKEQSEII